MEYYGTNLTEAGHCRFDISSNYMVGKRNLYDLPFDPEYLTNNLQNGETIFYQGGGYTVFGISGGCYDTRPGTKTIFWIKEIVSKVEMIERINNNILAKNIINNIKFKINW